MQVLAPPSLTRAGAMGAASGYRRIWQRFWAGRPQLRLRCVAAHVVKL